MGPESKHTGMRLLCTQYDAITFRFQFFSSLYFYSNGFHFPFQIAYFIEVFRKPLTKRNEIVDEDYCYWRWSFSIWCAFFYLHKLYFVFTALVAHYSRTPIVGRLLSHFRNCVFSKFLSANAMKRDVNICCGFCCFFLRRRCYF